MPDDYDKVANSLRNMVHNEVLALKIRMDGIEAEHKQLMYQFGQLMSKIALHELYNEEAQKDE